ncbi:ATP synthase subunit I [Cytobacillus gottheilii]|uniref:ATP synthase subunit I n=2 Tax=Bacillaceae TaxID=186817 RepID=A0A7V7RL76_9BACI|nr:MULTISPECIES: ATP synthase subunit I [Bacillaceae]KAB2332513.1 ATP synthase subunit I [Bacillus mesophilum]QVY61373.1 ATP synthase subunit I [Cytobacillus gottheilii]
MPEFKLMFIRQRKYMFYLLAIYVLGWGFTSHQHIYLGLIIGTALSMYILWSMVRKIDQFGEAVATGRKVYSIGMISRMAVAALAVLIATRYPDQVHFISVIIGLMTAYIVIMIDFAIQTLQSALSKGER